MYLHHTDELLGGIFDEVLNYLVWKEWYMSNNNINFRWRQWGSSIPGLHTLDPPLAPIDMGGNLLANMGAKLENWKIF